MQTNARLAFQLLAAFVVILAAGMLIPEFLPPSKMSLQSRNVSNARQLALGCQVYAQDHEGRYPLHLSELEPDYIVAVKSLRCSGVGKNDKPLFLMDWLYFGAGFDENNAPKVLIASPQATTVGKEQKRVVVQGDDAGSVIKEDEYQKILAETVRQMRALDDARHPPKPAAAKPPQQETPPK